MQTKNLVKVLAASALACTMLSAPAAFAIDQQIDSATVSLPAPTQSLDPTASVSATDRAIYGLTNGTLMRLTVDGEVVPGMAESVTLSDDFKSATVKLKSGLKFSDGSDLTAEDVAATYNRHMGMESSVLRSFLGRVEKVEMVDDLTVEFTFPAPFPSFVDYIVSGSSGIFPSEKINDEDFFTNPVVSGPYTITSTWSGNRIELTANENFYAGTPAIKNITFTVIDDANSAVSQIQAGQLDYAGDLPPNFVIPLRDTPGVEVVANESYGFYDIRFWNRDGVFSDVNMRKAVAAAIDREVIVNAIFGDINVPLGGFWPPVMAGHDDSKPVKADPDKVREYLAQTECATGCEIRMMYSDGDFPFASQLALIVQNQLAAYDITVKLERLETATLVKRLFAGDYDMVPGAMAGAVNVPDQLLGNALLGTGFLKAEFSGYNSDEMNALIEKVNTTSGEERAQAVADIEALFTEDQPYLPYAPWIRIAASRLPADAISIVGTQISIGLVE